MCSQHYCNCLPNHRQWQPLNLPVQLFGGGECPAILDWLTLGEIISPVSLHGRRRDSGAGDEVYKLGEFRAQSRKLYTEGRTGGTCCQTVCKVEGGWPEAHTVFSMNERATLMEGKEVSVLCGRL